MFLEPFPPLDAADDQGLLAIGGDLSPERLILAYRNGIFPWYNPGEVILWWSPDPRCVIFPHAFRPSRSLAKSIRNRGYRVSYDQAFENVVRCCAGSRKHQSGTWIDKDMFQAYLRLYQLGVAHSVEVWDKQHLVGGLYGVAVGSIFFGESMFSHQTDASKVGLSALIKQLIDWQFTLIDCQVSSAHILSLGAVEIPRAQFMHHLKQGIQAEPAQSGPIRPSPTFSNWPSTRPLVTNHQSGAN